MPTAILDTVKDSGLDYSETDPSAWTRGGVVVDLDGDPGTALAQCLGATNMPAFGTSVSIGTKTLFFHRLIIKPVETATDKAEVLLLYDNNLNGQTSALTITFDGYEQEYETNRIPGTREPITVKAWYPKGGDDGNFTQAPIHEDLGMGRFSYPMRQVTVSGIQQGKPPKYGTYDGNAGAVNKNAFLGLPAGWWKLLRGTSSSSPYQGFFSFSVSAVTKNIEDWSEIRQLYSQKYGFWAKLDPADEAALHGVPYKHGIMIQVPGATRFGPCPVIDFSPLFTQIPDVAVHPFALLFNR